MVRKRGNHWHYDFQVKGTRYRGAIPEARTKHQAQQAEAAIRLSVFEGRYGGETAKADFCEFVETCYLPWAEKNKRSVRDDRLHCRTLCAAFKGKSFDQMTPMLIEGYKRRRSEMPTHRGTRRQPASVNRELEVLSKIFTIAKDYGFTAVNPCSRVKRLSAQNMRNRYLSVEEEERLLAACTGTRAHLRDLIVFAVRTGMRKGEILDLKWTEIDFERRMILVNESKSGKPRTVPMSDGVVEILEAKARTAPWVWVHPYHPTRRLTEIKRAWASSCAEAGISNLRFHDLRHTAATRMAEAGTDAFTLASILGHSTIQMSARYTHATDQGKRAAIEKLSRYGRNVTIMSQTKTGSLG